MGSDVHSRVSAYAIAVAEHQLLLTQLSDSSPVFMPGLWHLPGGGIDPGEQPRRHWHVNCTRRPASNSSMPGWWTRGRTPLTGSG